MSVEKIVNNDVYRRLGNAWWGDEVAELSTIRYFVNPVRFSYFKRILDRERAMEDGRRALLDVGCGGGLLAEELARAGMAVTGIDLASETIETARAHATATGLAIAYEVGTGEHLPFADASFDHVTCCDVLEHVDDVERVIAEISRVLRPGGLFFYDTINRTFISKLVMIKLMQEWSSTALFSEPDVHVWERFIKPAELVAILERHGLEPKQMRGMTPGARNSVAMLLNFRRCKQGKIDFEELGRRLDFRESDLLGGSYMGWASRRRG